QNLVFTDTLDPNTTLIPGSVAYPTSVTSTIVTDADLQSIVAAARARWQAAGISTAQRAILDQATFTLTDLEGVQVAQSIVGRLGANVLIDLQAGKQGWFVDAT